MIDLLFSTALDWPLGTILIAFLSVAILDLILVIIDYAFGHNEPRKGVVIDKSYTPSTHGTGIGPTIGGNGGVSVVFTSNPEKYILFIRRENGETDELDTSRESYLKHAIGDSIEYIVRIGWLSRSAW